MGWRDVVAAWPDVPRATPVFIPECAVTSRIRLHGFGANRAAANRSGALEHARRAPNAPASPAHIPLDIPAAQSATAQRRQRRIGAMMHDFFE